MTPKESTTSRPWFICPSWAAVVPLLAHAIATDPESDEAAAAAAELQTLAAGLDGWNEKGPRLLAALREIVALYEADPDDLETMDKGAKIAREAVALLEGAA